MTVSEHLEQASVQLKSLSERANQAEANVKAAADKEQAELRDQVDAAEESASEAAAKLKSSAEASTDELSEHWDTVQKNWREHIANVRHDAEAARADRDARRSERRAERAEDDAVAAIAFVFVALEEAEFRVLNAALSRVEADSLAAG